MSVAYLDDMADDEWTDFESFLAQVEVRVADGVVSTAEFVVFRRRAGEARVYPAATRLSSVLDLEVPFLSRAARWEDTRRSDRLSGRMPIEHAANPERFRGTGTVFIAWEPDEKVYVGYWDRLPIGRRPLSSKCLKLTRSRRRFIGGASGPRGCSSARPLIPITRSGLAPALLKAATQPCRGSSSSDISERSCMTAESPLISSRQAALSFVAEESAG
jgi:hypothetical protein